MFQEEKNAKACTVCNRRDISKVWSKMSQQWHSKLLLDKYYPHMAPACEWFSTEIVLDPELHSNLVQSSLD